MIEIRENSLMVMMIKSTQSTENTDFAAIRGIRTQTGNDLSVTE